VGRKLVSLGCSLLISLTILLSSVLAYDMPELLGIIQSDTVNTLFGYRILPLGDQNGDGKDDILVYDLRRSQYLYYGRELFDTISIYDLRFDSTLRRSNNIGDVNGDGYDDFVFGGRSLDGWRLNLYHGGPSIDSVRDCWFGDDTLRGIGYTVRGYDLNANGIDDIVSWSDSQSSVVLFELGSDPDSTPDMEISPPNEQYLYTYASFGEGIASGDFNGDGKYDLAVSLRESASDYERGAVYLYWGGSDFDTIPEMIIYRPGPFIAGTEKFGRLLESLGDVSGDGYDDFFAGSGGASNDHLGFVFFGGPDIDTIPDITIDLWPVDASLGGDLNGDGYNDLLIFGDIINAFVLYGGPDMDSLYDLRINKLDIPGWQDRFSMDCAGIGDFNGDGVNDFALSAVGLYGHGEVYICSGVENNTDVAYDCEPLIPDGFTLSQNYPNPFNPITTIEFAIPVKSEVTLKIYNILGKEIRQLLGQSLSAGTYRVKWDGTDASGSTVASGVYLYRIKTDEFVQSRKMILMK